MSLGHVGESLLPRFGLSEGWSALVHRAHDALTFFHHDEEEQDAEEAAPDASPWGVLAVDLVDHEDRVELRLEAPGVPREALRVEVHGGTLAISGHKRAETTRQEGRAVITARAFGSFRRMLPLPAGVNAEATTAQYRDGVLAIDIPKLSDASGKRIDVG